MHFLINSPGVPAKRRRVKRTAKRVRAKARARGKARTLDKKKSRRYSRGSASINRSGSTPATRHAKGSVSMAVRRRRRRKASAKKSSPRRRRVARRRRRVVALASNPRRRRRRTATATVARRRSTRRRYHRNPGISVGGIQRTVVEGVKDGATVFVAQVATRKIGAGVNGMIPASVGASSPALRGIATRLIAAVAVSMISRRVAPARSKLATAGAFAEVVNFAVAQNPTASKFLSAFPSRRVLSARGGRRGVNAWPTGQQLPAGRTMNAWPMRSVGLPVQV